MTATMVATIIYSGERIFENDWDTSISDVFSDLVDDYTVTITTSRLKIC